MQTLLVFLAVATLSVLASSKRLLEAGRFFQLAQLSASGMLFLVLGAAVGPHAGGLLTAEDLSRLRPLTALGLG
ncbi:MAG: sodium:proton exchanger, partial [Myxococcota bacterium]